MTAEDDLVRIRAWFERLAEHVRAVDFEGARPLFAEDMVAFGTVADYVLGREAVEAAQWRSVWPFIDGFRWRPHSIRAIVAPDRLLALGLAVWDSTGFTEEGRPFERPGRASVAFGRSRIGAEWVARHTHFSLFHGVPGRSFGRRAG
ncbi:MAG: nuclear transport factor 2 family protein [Alphaproteobacteria bacterium]|nr:nuclear transport factor 2 family protein [Alphaproteobacteria bacterium]